MTTTIKVSYKYIQYIHTASYIVTCEHIVAVRTTIVLSQYTAVSMLLYTHTQTVYRYLAAI